MITCYYEDGNEASLRHAVVDSLVIKDGQILMVKRNKKLLEGGKWGVVGGFMERDESCQEAAEREIYEETGWEVKDISLIAINDNPNRPNEDRQNIAFIFVCQAVKQTGKPDWEADEVKWFDLDEVPNDEQIAFDHADFIKLYRQYLKKSFELPVLVGHQKAL